MSIRPLTTRNTAEAPYIPQHAHNDKLRDLETTTAQQVRASKNTQEDMRAALKGEPAIGNRIEQLDALPMHPATKGFVRVLGNFQQHTTPTFQGKENLRAYVEANPTKPILFYMEHTMMTIPDTGTIAGELATITGKPVTVFVAGNITWPTGFGSQVCKDVHIKPISAKAIKEALARGEHVLVLADGFPGANRANDCMDDDSEHPHVIGDGNGKGNFPRDLLLHNEALAACAVATGAATFHVLNTEIPESVRTVRRPYSDAVAARSIAPFTVTPGSLVEAVQSGHHYLHGGAIVGPLQPPTQSPKSLTLSRIKQVLETHDAALFNEIELLTLNQLTLDQVDRIIAKLEKFTPTNEVERNQAQLMPLDKNGLDLLKAVKKTANQLKLPSSERQECSVAELITRLEPLLDEGTEHNHKSLRDKENLQRIKKEINFLITREFIQNQVCHPAIMGTPGTHADDENSVVFKTYQMMKQLPQDIIDFHTWAKSGKTPENANRLGKDQKIQLEPQRKTLVKSIDALTIQREAMDTQLTAERETLIAKLSDTEFNTGGWFSSATTSISKEEADQLIQLLSVPHTAQDLQKNAIWQKLHQLYQNQPKAELKNRALSSQLKAYEKSLQARETLVEKIEVNVRMLEKLFIQHHRTALDFLPERIEALDITLLTEADRQLLLDHDVSPTGGSTASAKLFAEFYFAPITRALNFIANVTEPELARAFAEEEKPTLKPLYQDAWTRLANQATLSQKHIEGRQAINERNKTPYQGLTVAEIGITTLAAPLLAMLANQLMYLSGSADTTTASGEEAYFSKSQALVMGAVTAHFLHRLLQASAPQPRV